MEYTLYCMVLGEETIFPVVFDISRTVGELKTEIKIARASDFQFSAHRLTLYQIEIDVSDKNKYMDIMHEVTQPSYQFNPKIALHPPYELSSYFKRGLKRVIQILVEPPPSKSIDP